MHLKQNEFNAENGKDLIVFFLSFYQKLPLFVSINSKEEALLFRNKLAVANWVETSREKKEVSKKEKGERERERVKMRIGDEKGGIRMRRTDRGGIQR